MKIFGFKGGVHPADNKRQTENKPTERLAMPKMLYIPLLQHIGAVLEPTVAIGEKVLKGQKIADSQAFLVSPIHASTSGTIKKIENYDFPLMGRVKTIFLEPDGEDKWCDLATIENWKEATKEQLLAKIKECGIVGIGGASFPTHVKLNPPADAKTAFPAGWEFPFPKAPASFLKDRQNPPALPLPTVPDRPPAAQEQPASPVHFSTGKRPPKAAGGKAGSPVPSKFLRRFPGLQSAPSPIRRSR